MKMAELMNLNFNLLGVLTRMGMNFGFGEETVEEICKKGGVDVNAFLLICSVYAYDGYIPSGELLNNTNLHDLVKYLRLSHTYYLDVAVRELGSALEQVLKPCTEKQRSVLWSFFTQYKEELTKHFEYEEKTVFPHVEAVLDHKIPKDLTLSEYQDNHASVSEKLEDLKSLVMKYTPAVCDQQQIYRALFYIYTLELDMEKHIAIEDCILRQEGEELSDREKEILVSVAKGMLNKEIADQYNISIHTVISHRKNITRKTGIKTVAGLTVYALLNNLIEIQ
jgi:regulator of cell morphogenesis and NO signaling